MHATPMSKINHENNVLVLLLVHRGAIKPIESEDVNNLEDLYCISSENFPEIKFYFRKFSGRLE